MHVRTGEDMEHPLGIVPTDARGSLPYALVHGESLVAAASWALTTAGVELFDFSASFAEVQEADRALVVHDPLCPLTPAGFIEAAVEECERTGAVVVGVRQVTDTVKEYDGSTVGATVDREQLLCVTSPVVLPAAVVQAVDGLDIDDLAALVGELSMRFPVRHLEAPPLGRRIVGEQDLEVLVALSRATDPEA
jgi:2-C-methyl-D-erythritol 4-phosphate cytidylyltransferase